MNPTYRLQKFIYQPMTLVEIYSPGNQQWYWMSFQVIIPRRIELIEFVFFSPKKGISQRHYESVIQLPDWIHGRWFTMGTSGINTNTVDVNNTQLMMKMSDEQTMLYDLKFTRIMFSKRQNDNIIRIKAKSLQQWWGIEWMKGFLFIDDLF